MFGPLHSLVLLVKHVKFFIVRIILPRNDVPLLFLTSTTYAKRNNANIISAPGSYPLRADFQLLFMHLQPNNSRIRTAIFSR